MSPGQTVLITGASHGIGLAVARRLAELGHEVVLVARDDKSGSLALAQVRPVARRPPILFTADLAIQDQVRTLARDVRERFETLPLLIHNAATVSPIRKLTADGMELQLAVNHLAPFLLTYELLPVLRRSPPARIVVTASQVERNGRITFPGDPGSTSYHPDQAYNQSKLANILFTYELAARLAGSGITVNCLHPGVVRTRLLDSLLSGSEPEESSVLARSWALASGILRRIGVLPPVRDWALTPEQGAATTVYVATDPSLEKVTGRYFVDCREAQSSTQSHDPLLKREVWEASARLTQVPQDWFR